MASALPWLRWWLACRFRLLPRRSAVDPDHGPYSPTFCIAHYNAPAFLDLSLASIRSFHPRSRVIVADSDSSPQHLRDAAASCRRHGAELHPLILRHRHTGLLNYMFRQVRTPAAVFMDQDCLLLGSVRPLTDLLLRGIWLAGPADEMFLRHPNLARRYPPLDGFRFRSGPEFVHASLMALAVDPIRRVAASRPFEWRAHWGPQPLERYYGITQLVRAQDPGRIAFCASKHTGYGLGQVYFLDDQRLAYHNWYSGQVFAQTGKMDGLFDVDWLLDEARRFRADFAAGRADLSGV